MGMPAAKLARTVLLILSFRYPLLSLKRGSRARDLSNGEMNMTWKTAGHTQASNISFSCACVPACLPAITHVKLLVRHVTVCSAKQTLLRGIVHHQCYWHSEMSDVNRNSS